MSTFSSTQRDRLAALWSQRAAQMRVVRDMDQEERQSIREDKLLKRLDPDKGRKQRKRKSSGSETVSQVVDRSLHLAAKARSRLSMSRFRAVNEMLYTHRTEEAVQVMDESTFSAYHTAYADIADKWPIRPIDSVCRRMRSLFPLLGQDRVFADMGCGPRPLIAHNFPRATVHSFDLVSVDQRITAADIAHVPLPDAVCDCVVFSLSLMGSNIRDQVKEGARILKKETGVMLIAEVASRFRSDQTLPDTKRLKSSNKSDTSDEPSDRRTDNSNEDGDEEAGDTVQSFVDKCAGLGLRLEHREELGSNNYFLVLQFRRRPLTQKEKKKRREKECRKKKKNNKSTASMSADEEMRLKVCQYKPR